MIPVGGVATSAPFCIDETYPHFRFAYKVDSIGATGFVAFVTYQSGGMTKTASMVSSQQLSLTPTKWGLTPPSPLATLIPLSGGHATVRIKIIGVTALGNNVLATRLGDAVRPGGLAARQPGREHRLGHGGSLPPQLACGPWRRAST